MNKCVSRRLSGPALKSFVGLLALTTLACAGAEKNGPGTGGSTTMAQGGSRSGGSSGAIGASSGGVVTSAGMTSSASGGVVVANGGSTVGAGVVAAGAPASGGSLGALGGAGASSVTGGTTSTAGGALTGGTGGAATAPPPSLLGDVAFSTPSQSFKDQLAVGMTTTLAGAEIRYTTDGSVPTATSMPYAGTALTITATTQLRAQAFSAGMPAGLPSTAIYIARTFELSSALPIVLVDGYGKGASTDKNVYKDAGVMVFEPTGGAAQLSNLPTVAARAGYHLRGQSSSSFPQKPYKLEFHDNLDADMKLPVLGMPADADWALIAPYYDRALIRNPFTYTLATEMGRNAPRTRFVEVYINYAARPVQESDYQGIYWLSETIKINNHRLDLKKLDVADTALPKVSGGFIFKFDQAATDAKAPHLTCAASAGVTCWTDCEVADPAPLPAPEQLTWLNQYVQSFHDTLFTNPIGNYAQYIDVPSFVDDLIINELTRNVDAYVRSSYYYKERDGLLQGGPYWDYNFALGVGGMNTTSPTPGTNDGGFQYQGRSAGSLPMRNVNSWFPKLMSDPAFVAQVKTRWKALRGNLLSQASLEQRITMITAQLNAASVARDYAKWPVSMVLPGGHSGIVYGPSAASWEAQVQAMHDFVIARVAWLDTQWQ